MKHEFARLIWVLDIARALADLSDDDLNEVFKLARALGVEGAFLTSCELARYSFDTVLPSRVVTAIERQPVISAQAHALWERVVTAAQYQCTLYAVSSSFFGFSRCDREEPPAGLLSDAPLVADAHQARADACAVLGGQQRRAARRSRR